MIALKKAVLIVTHIVIHFSTIKFEPYRILKAFTEFFHQTGTLGTLIHCSSIYFVDLLPSAKRMMSAEEDKKRTLFVIGNDQIS
jgi:hypothetical protein